MSPGAKSVLFLIYQRFFLQYLKNFFMLDYGFCKVHVYIPLGSQKTPESGRKVKDVPGGFPKSDLLGVTVAHIHVAAQRFWQYEIIR